MTKLSMSDAPRHAQTVLGLTVQAPAVFTEGHALSSDEAAFLNRTHSGAVGNSYANTIRKALNKPITDWETNGKKGKKPEPFALADLDWDHQAEFDAKFEAYSVGPAQRGVGTTSKDPTETFTRAIALSKVKELIHAKKRKITEFYEKDADGMSALDKLVNDYIDRNPWVAELAKSQVAAMASASSDDDILAGVDLEEQTEAA